MQIGVTTLLARLKQSVASAKVRYRKLDATAIAYAYFNCARIFRRF
jgi:hypothetical protein